MSARIPLLIALCFAASCADEEPLDRNKAEDLYMDVHDLGPGSVTAADVATAHEADLKVQEEFGVSFLRYWVDEANGKVYCLSKAPSAEAVTETHRKAHGLLPDVIGPVSAGE